MTADPEQELLALFRRLSGDDRNALLAFAQFLAARDEQTGVAAVAAPTEPQPEPRPDGESVVMAIKRLTRVYPMLDRRKLMGPTSLLMSQHALQGRPAPEVIEELEVVFERHYRESSGNAQAD
ncbi:MAG: hypothetical protein AB7O69_03735 [Burkholderiales bacterium]